MVTRYNFNGDGLQRYSSAMQREMEAVNNERRRRIAEYDAMEALLEILEAKRKAELEEDRRRAELNKIDASSIEGVTSSSIKTESSAEPQARKQVAKSDERDIVIGNTTEKTSIKIQRDTITAELKKIETDYKKRRDVLENKKKQIRDSALLQIVGVSPVDGGTILQKSNNADESAQVDKIDNLLQQLQEEYELTVELVNKYVARGGIAADSFHALATERYKDDIALTKRLKLQHLDIAKNPNADKTQLKPLAKKINELERRNNARQTKIDLIEKWISVNGLPNNINELPESLRSVAKDIFSKGGDLDNGQLTPSEIQARVNRIKDITKNVNSIGSTANPNADQQALLLKSQIENEMRIIEEAHDIPRVVAQFENDESIVGRTLKNASLPLGVLRSGVFLMALGEDRERYNTLAESIRTVDKALKYQEINDRFYKGDTNLLEKVSNVGVSFFTKATDPTLWDFGLSDIKKAVVAKEIKDVKDKGFTLNNEQQDFLNAAALDAVLNDKYDEYQDAWGVSAGEMFAESLPFMLDMAIGSHGLASAAKASAKAGVKSAVKFLSGELGKSMQKAAVREAIEQYGKNGVKAILARNIKQIPGLATRLSGDALQALALSNTVQAAKTASDVLELHTGLVDYNVDQNGKITGTGFKKGLDWQEAVWEAETRAWIENFSEALGEYNIFTNMFKPLNRTVRKAIYKSKMDQSLADVVGVNAVAKNMLRGAKAINDAIDTFQKYNPLAKGKVSDFLHAAKYHGFVGESLEEYYGMALEHAFGVSDSGKSFWEDITSEDNFWDIVGGVALSQFVLGSAGGVNVLSARYRYKNAQKKASKHFGDNWQAIEDAIVNASSENVASIVSRMAGTMTSVEDKQHLFDYYTELMSYRGASYAQQIEQQNRDSSNHAKAVRDSYLTGYMITTQNERNDLDRAISAMKANLDSVFGTDIDDLTDAYGGVDRFLNEYLSTEDINIKRALVAYDNMLATREGANQRQNDDLNILLQQAESDVMCIRYRDGKNKVKAAQLKNGSVVFLTNGDVNDEHENLMASTIDGQRFVLDRENLATDEKGKYVIDEYDVGDFVREQQRRVLADYAERDTRRMNASPDVRTGSTVQLGPTLDGVSAGGTLTVLGTARDGGVLYSVKEVDPKTGITKETQFKAESTAKMMDIIRDANNERQNAISIKYIEAAAKQLNKPDVDQPVSDKTTDEVADEVAELINRSVEESLRNTTEYIPSGRRGVVENGEGPIVPNRSNSLKTYNNAINAIKYASSAKTYTDFLQLLEQAGFAMSTQYGGRFKKLYDAYTNGYINEKELALVFIPNDERKNVAGKKLAKRFDSLEFDSDGQIIPTRKPRKIKSTVDNAVDDSKTPLTAQQEVKEVAEQEIDKPNLSEQNKDVVEQHGFITSDDIDRTSAYYSMVADWIDQDVNGGRAKVISSDGKTAEIEYKTEQNGVSETFRTKVPLKDKTVGNPTVSVETTPPLTPSSSTAASVASADEVLHSNAQQAAVKALLDKVAEDKERVRIDLRTGHDYFIERDGKLVMYQRVHSVLDEMFVSRSSKLKNQHRIKQQLLSLRSDMNEWEKAVRKAAEEHNKQFPDEEPVAVDTYIQYVKNNPDQIGDVEDSIADICSNETVHMSVKYGNLIDEICRTFFAGKLASYSKYKDNMSERTYNEIVRQLSEIKKLYDSRGWILITDPVFLYSELQNANGDVIRVAGETDMIAVDSDGKYHIIDFKTSFGSFVPKLTGRNRDVVYDRFSQALPTLDKDTTEPRNAKRTYRQQYSNQLTMYSIMLNDNLDGNVGSLSILPWVLNYNMSDNNVLLLDDGNRYGASNFDVVINDEKNGYVKDETGLDVKRPVLIELERSNDVLDQYTTRKQADLQKTKYATDRAKSAIDNMNVVIDDNNLNVTDDVKDAAARVSDDQRDITDAAESTTDAVVHDNAYKQSEKNAAEAQQLAEEAELQATDAAHKQLTDSAAQAKSEAKGEVLVDDWTQHTTTHTHTFENSIGIEDAVAIDDPSKKLKYVTGEKDFITKSKMVFGTVMVNGQQKLTVQITYKGVTYQPVTISTARNPIGNKFYGRVMLALRKAKAGQVVVPTVVRRTGGKMHAGTSLSLMTETIPGRKPLVGTKPGEGEVYLYDVLLNPSHPFGRIVEQGGMYAIVVPGINGGQNIPLLTFRENTEGLSGMYGMALDLHYEEPNSQTKIPVVMSPSKMTQGDADLIIEILDGLHTADGSSDLSLVFVQNNIQYGLTNAQVLSLLIPFGPQTGKQMLHVEYDTLHKKAVKIIGKVAGDDLTERVFYLDTQSGKLALRDFLINNVSRNLSDVVMQHRLGSRDRNNPFSKLLGFLNNPSGQLLLRQKKQILFGNSSIVFDLDDFKDPSNPNDVLGLTGLGWYMKRGFIETRFDGVDNTLLDFDDTAQVEIVDDIPVDEPTSAQVTNNPVEVSVTESQNNGITYGIDDVIDDAFAFDVEYMDKRVTTQSNGEKISEQKARARLEKIFGSNGVKIEFVDDVIAMLRSGASVVGRCYSDSIILSRKAESGVEYHEAFHRVVELLLTSKQRDKVYSAYRNAKKGRKTLTDKLVAEALADNFMYFMMNKPTFKFTFNLKLMYTQIKDWVEMLKNIGSLRLFYLYTVTSLGKFRDVLPTKEAQERFKAFAANGLNFTKRERKLPNIVNERHYRTLVKSLTYLFMNPSTQRIEWSGANISELSVDKELAMKSAIWKQWMEPIGMKNGTPVYRIPYETRAALKELMDNWDVVLPDIASHIAQFSTDFKVKYEEANHSVLDTAVPDPTTPDDADSTIDDDDPANSGAEAVDGHIKASYEFNPFNRASEKVKFFFAGIPDYTFNADGKKVPRLNDCGLPELMPAAQVYARMLNDLHEISSVSDLRKELKRLGEKNYMYNVISRRFEKLWDAVDPTNGTPVDYDAEQLLVQITQTVRQNKNVFEIAKMKKSKYGYTVYITSSGSQHAAAKFTKDWSQNLAAGVGYFIKLNERGDYVMKNGMSPYVFTAIVDSFIGANGMLLALSPNNQSPKPFELNGVQIDLNNAQHVEMCKNYVVRTLSWFGINFEKDALDYTLLQRYQDVGAKGLYEFLTDLRFGSFKGFLDFVSSLNYNGKLNITNGTVLLPNQRAYVGLSEVFTKIGFISNLANYKYEYRHSFDQLSILTTNNKTFYVMSENNFLNDRLFEIQNDPAVLSSMKSNPYIYNVEQQMIGESAAYGSLLVQHVDKNKGKLEIATLIGFSSSDAGVEDVDYAHMSAREDYVSKFSALSSGRMLFPTQSDKKTWGYIKGLFLPGLDFNKLPDTVPSKKGRIVNDEVLDQLIAYAKTEDASITRFLSESIPDSERVLNYDESAVVEEVLPNGEKIKHTVKQGGRFSTLLGVWDNGRFIEFNKLFDENGVYQDEQMCLRIAHEYFFDKSLEELRDMINEILLRQVEKELLYICELGIIQDVGKQNQQDSNMLRYQNVGLDYKKLDSIYGVLAAKYPNGDQDKLRRTALMMLVGDVVAKGIISMNEYERVFSGHPSFYGFKYDKNGHLYNRTDDQSKRLGGLVSTGFNNVILPGIEEDYVCAEVNDEKASEDNIDELYKLIHEGTIRDTYLKNRIAEEGISFDDVDRAEQLSKEVDEMEIEDIWNTFDDVVKTVITNSVNSKVNAFKKINVTDGASYISELMCENLLRMAGSFNGDVKRAFDILTGKEVDGKVYTTKDIRELAKAYQLVLTSVIGAQKYTAFGFRERKHTDAEGNTTITHIPYYNKTALFPIFKSIATGPLADFYQKMQNNRIDMIMMRSAVKVGGQGSVSVDWNNIDNLKFNTYTQKIKYLRKQFNTDPKDKEEMSIGTQTKKVALSTLVPGRTYVVGGENLSATLVRNRIMECLNAMSYNGMQATKELFFTDGLFDVNKFSSVLTKELVGRGASAEMIDAVSVENGQLKVPLAALSGMNWILSIIKSMIDKRVIDTNTPGKAFYQRSPWGMEGVSVLSDENIPPSLNDGKPLQVKNEDGSMDVVLSIDYFEDILKKAKVKTGKKIKKTRKVVKKEYDTYEKYGVPHTDYTRTHDVQVEEEYETDEYVSVSSLSFEEQRQWLIDHKIIGGPKYDEDGKPIPGTGASANIIGYRIPTQAVSSIHAMRCVDVIPVIRDTIIMPKAITSITGSDYDIDKMFLSRLYYNPKGTVYFEEHTHEWYANRLINAYLSVLKDSDHSFQDLNGSIDNDTSFLTEIRDDLREGIQKETLMPYSGYILREQSNTKNVFISGKFGIAPFALNNNMHILMQLYNVKLYDSESIMTRLGLTNLGGYQDRYGKSIMSWFSGLINAHVDAAKDPWIPELNVNLYTYNLVSLLTHAGLGKDTFYFTTQPIMRQLAISYQNANGIYMNDLSKSKTKISEEAELAVVKNMIDAHFGQVFKSYNDAIKYYQGTCGFNIDDAILALFAKDCDVMRKVAKKHIGEFGSKYTSVEDDVEEYELTINDKKYKMSAFDIQMIVYSANTQFKPYAKALSSLVQHTKIDTKKQGKNLVELQKYLLGVAELFEPDARGEYRALFDTQSLDNMYRDSYIQHQTQVATNLFRQILGNQMIEGTDQFVLDVDRVLTTVGNTGKDPKVINLVQNAIMAKIKSKYFFGQNGYCERYKINPESLISGSSTIYDKLLLIKTNLINDLKYRLLIDSRTGGPINYLLLALVSGNKYEHDGGVKFILSLDFVIDDTFNADDLTLAWEDLLSDSRYPELQQFARELIVYAFITSGDYGGKNLFKYVPNSWKLGKIDNDDNSYSEYMRNLHTQYVNGFLVISDQDIEDIVLNNWYNDSIVPKYNMYSKNKPVFQSFTSGKDVNGTPLLIAGVDNSGNSTITNPKTYIKIPKYDNQSAVKGRDAYNVYKIVSFGSSKTGSNYPIYLLIDHKGGVYDKRERVLLYYANERSNSEELVNRSLKTLLDLLGVTATTPGDALLTIADYVYEHKTNLSVLVQSNIVDKTLAAMIEGVNRQRSAGASYESDQTFTQRPNYYEGNIIPDGSTIMVFGSNPLGIHGAGAARYAKDMFGAKIGVGEGMTGNAYALPTKDIEASKGTEWYRPGGRQRQKVLDYYRTEQSGFEFNPSNITYDLVKNNPVKRTISPYDIVESIKSLYEAARQTPEKVFKVAYTNGLTELTLNGYIGAEMIAMFKEAGPIPTNVHFSRAWVSTGMFDLTIQEPKVNTPGTYEMPQEDSKPRLIKKGATEYENVYLNMTDSEYEEWKRNQNASTPSQVKSQLILQFGEGTPNAKLTELVFKALEVSDIVFEKADLGEGVSGRFVASENKILYNPDALLPNTLLHEAIHAATSYYLKTANRSNLPKEIQQAIKEIEYCYDLLKQDFIERHFYENGKLKPGVDVEKAFSFWIQDVDLYGYSSPTEMIAEISKPGFLEHVRDFDKRHKGQNIFDKLVSAILKLFGIQKEYKSVEKTIKDAMVTLLTNPNKELMLKYAEENGRSKDNYKLFMSSNTVSLDNKKIVYDRILPQLEEIDESVTIPEVTINIPTDVAKYAFSSNDGGEIKLHDGLVIVFRDGPLFMSLVGNILKSETDVKLTFKVYGLDAIKSTEFNTQEDEYGRLLITSSKSVYDDLKVFGDVSEPVSPFGEGRIGALHEQRWILTNRLREVVNKKQVVQKLFISPIKHDPFVINTPVGKLRGINGFIDNGKSIFGLVSMRINISENVVTSPFIFPTEHLFDNKYNFARLDNSVKGNYFTIAYNILNYLGLNGFRSVESEWYRGKSEKNERIENLKKMFGNDIENLINIQEDLREEYNPVFGNVTVPHYKFVINISKFSNLIASNHDVNVDNDVIRLVKSAISKLYDRSEEDISTGREALEKLNASADALRLQISELDDEIRKEQLVYLSNLGKKQLDKCNGGFEDLPF